MSPALYAEAISGDMGSLVNLGKVVFNLMGQE